MATKNTTANKAPAKKAAAVKKTTAKKAVKKVQEPQHIGLVKNDSWLEPSNRLSRDVTPTPCGK